VSSCIYLIFDFLVLTGFLTVDMAFFTHDNLATLVLGSFISARVTGQFIVRLKLFSDGNCPLD